MKKKILALGVCASMLAVAVVGGTMAYFTDTDQDTNVFTVGNVAIEQIEEQRPYNTETKKYTANEAINFTTDFALVPAVITAEDGKHYYDGQVKLQDGKTYSIWDKTINNEVDKFITVKNTGTEEAYIRTIIAFEDNADGTLTEKLHTLWGGDEDGKYEELTLKPNADGKYVKMDSGKSIYWLQNADGSWLTLDLEGTGTSTYTVAVFTYKDYIAKDETTSPSLMQLWLDPSATNEWAEAVGKEYKIYAASLAVQADGFDDTDNFADPASAAMDAAFDMTKDNLLGWLKEAATP